MYMYCVFLKELLCLSSNHTDSVSKAVGALKLLAESIDKKDSIIFMYEEYNVSCSQPISVC